MSYYLEVLKDCPQTLYMFSTGLTDGSGHGIVAEQVGTLDYTAAPLVSGALHALRHKSGAYLATPFPYAQIGYERQAFSLESWFFPNASTVAIASRFADTDGLIWLNGSLYFSVRTSAGYIRTQYTPPSYQNMHIVGVYNGEKLELWVNGEIVDSYSLTDAEKALSLYNYTSNSALYAGNGAAIQQGLATYYQALSPLKIRNHYNAGKMSVGIPTTSGMYGGVREKISNETANIFLDRGFDTESEWSEGSGDCLIGDVLSSPTNSVGVLVAGSWDIGIPLDAGGTSIQYMQMSYKTKGVVVIYTSLDGITWTVHNNFGKIAGTTPGYNPTGKTLRVRVTFAAGSYGEVQSLDIHGYRDMTVTPATRPITISASGLFYDQHEILDYDIASGLYTGNQTLTIGATSDAQEYRTLSFWYYNFGSAMTVNVTPTTYYENNASITLRDMYGEWIHAVYVFPVKTDALTITGNVTIAAPTLYEQALTAAQVDLIFRSYTGVPHEKVDGTGAVQVSAPTIDIYANNWSITGAG